MPNWHPTSQPPPRKLSMTLPGSGPSCIEYPESRVLIVMTGGTICMRESAEGLVPATGFLDDALRPRPSFNDGSVCDPIPVRVDEETTVDLPSLRTPISTYSRHIRYTLHEFKPLLDSSSISSPSWSLIAQTIGHNYHLFDGFVILHGTDSLAYTASALSFLLSHLGKPVILTGSQSPIYALPSDATNNLLSALLLAGTFTIPEVCIFFHHKLMRGNRCTKISASQYDAFASPNFPPLATVTSAGIDVQWHSIRRPKVLAKFCVQPTLDSTNVACLRIFPGITPSLLDSVLRVPGLRGLILETYGSGTAPSGLPMLLSSPPSPTLPSDPLTQLGSLTDVLKSAITRGIVIVSVSQCASGTVSPLYLPATRLGNAGVVFGHDMTSEAALTKLFFLLAMRDIAYPDVVQQMSVSLRGEMTEAPFRTQFAPLELREPALSYAQTAFAALGYAVADGDAARVREMVDADPELLFAKDYVGNSALHLAAVGREVAVVRVLLERGASVHVRNAAGNTPLWNAERAGRRGNVELLAKAGGLLNVEELGAGALERK